MDLNRILLVFNVRPVVFARSALTVHSQTELGLNIYGTISEVQRDVADTQTMVSEIRCEILGSKKETNDQRRPVSDTEYIYTKCTLTAVQAKTRSANPTTNGTSVLYLHLVHLESHLRRRREPVSDVAS